MSEKHIHTMGDRRNVSVCQVVSCLPMDSATVRKVDLFGNLQIYAYFQLSEAFRYLLRPSSSLGAYVSQFQKKTKSVMEIIWWCRRGSLIIVVKFCIRASADNNRLGECCVRSKVLSL